MQRARGSLIVARPHSAADGPVVEEELVFTTLDELLALCAGAGQGAGLIRVEVTGTAAGHAHRLILDFGQFGPTAEQA